MTKVMVIVGTRAESIRLARVMECLYRTVDHVLVPADQNYDHQLNQVFFDDFGLRVHDHYLAVGTESLGHTLSQVLRQTEHVLLAEHPDAVLVLGALVTDGPDAAGGVIRWLEPFGFHDRNHLEVAAASMLSEAARPRRRSRHRGSRRSRGGSQSSARRRLTLARLMMTGLSADDVETALEIAFYARALTPSFPTDCEVTHTSNRAVRFVASSAASGYHRWVGMRRQQARYVARRSRLRAKMGRADQVVGLSHAVGERCRRRSVGLVP